MSASVTVDVAGGPVGGAARFRDELYRHLDRSGRKDVLLIGKERRIDPTWVLRREICAPLKSRRVALNNVGFVSPGGERWTLLRNALHFMTDDEESRLDSSLCATNRRKAAMVRLTARRADVLVAPSTVMAERVIRILPDVRHRVIVRLHPVSAGLMPVEPREPAILCPVLFEPYKHMANLLEDLITAIDDHLHPSIRLRVTAVPTELPETLTHHPRIELVGRLAQPDLYKLWARSRVIYFPPGLESFGYPLAEARVNGHPVIARDTPQNREIAGPALCGFKPGSTQSLLEATRLALTTEVPPDPAPFDPDSYFDWLLGTPL